MKINSFLETVRLSSEKLILFCCAQREKYHIVLMNVLASLTKQNSFFYTIQMKVK